MNSATITTWNLQTEINGIYIECDVRIAYDAIAEKAKCHHESHLDNCELFELSSVAGEIYISYSDSDEYVDADFVQAVEIDANDTHLFDIIEGIILEWLFETTEGNNEIEKAIKEDMAR